MKEISPQVVIWRTAVFGTSVLANEHRCRQSHQHLPKQHFPMSGKLILKTCIVVAYADEGAQTVLWKGIYTSVTVYEMYSVMNLICK